MPTLELQRMEKIFQLKKDVLSLASFHISLIKTGYSFFRLKSKVKVCLNYIFSWNSKKTFKKIEILKKEGGEMKKLI